MYSLKFKNFLFASLGVILLFSRCGTTGDNGELVGIRSGKWHPEKPYGMTLIPTGSFVMGKSDQDVAGIEDAPTRTVSVSSFYMDETEITNSEYRQFVEWVKDSTMRIRLAILAEENGLKPSKDKSKKAGSKVATSKNPPAKGKTPAKATPVKAGAKKGATAKAEPVKGKAKGKADLGSIGDFAFNEADPDEMTPYEKYMYENYYSIGTPTDPYVNRKINKKIKVIKDTKKFPDEFYNQVVDTMYLPLEASLNGQRAYDVDKLKFCYSWIDFEASAKSKSGKRQDFVKTEKVKVYPDTTVWIKDFSYSFNEPMHNDYFWHRAYSEYPVVGVKQAQAIAFCEWRTVYKNSFVKQNKNKKGGDLVSRFRLPSEAEWEYAARGGLQSGTYPWGGPYTKNSRGCFLANFKPTRGDYASDNALYTVEAKSFEANGYNLYNMAGNVSEWTATSYDPNGYDFVSSMTPTVVDRNNKRKVIRGGSWKDVAYMLQVSTRDYEYADSARSYIGFRTVQDYMGTSEKISTKKVKK